MKYIINAIEYWRLFRKEAYYMIKTGHDVGGILKAQLQPCDSAIEALQKQLPQNMSNNGQHFTCPSCQSEIPTRFQPYCHNCGQKLKYEV